MELTAALPIRSPVAPLLVCGGLGGYLIRSGPLAAA
ncbi:hypothetical protein NONI108955_03240 [Nocardia ninae]